LAAGEMTGPLRIQMSNARAKEEKDAQVSFRLKATVDSELRGTLDEPGKELLSVSNEDSNGNRHASLTSGTKCSTSNRIQRVVDIRWNLG
jgi:hypothetical protein